MYWNYFYHIWKTVSSSPFSNAIVFVDDGATISAPASFSITVKQIVDAGGAKIFTLDPDPSSPTLQDMNVEFVQDETAVEAGIAVHKYGAIICPTDTTASNYEKDYSIKAKIGDTTYTSSTKLVVQDYTTGTGQDAVTTAGTAVGATFTMAKDV